MADDKTVNLRVDGSQGEQALEGIERAAEGAAEAMGKLDAEVKQAEGATKGFGSAAKDTHVSFGPITLNGRLRPDDIENFEAAATRAVSKGIRNGNPDALSITRKK